MNPGEKILIVEDDHAISNYMGTLLTANGYCTLYAADAASAWQAISDRKPDLILLDLGLPDADGMTLLTQLRTSSHLPVIVVSARSREADKVSALDAGADDYITKPFGAAELIARIRTALRHTAFATSPFERTGTFTSGGLVIDYDKHRVTVDGEEVHLTQNEFRILSLLSVYSGKVLTYDFVIREMWGPTACGNNQILRVNMANIRRKIEKNPADPSYIFTEIGVGYRMKGPDE